MQPFNLLCLSVYGELYCINIDQVTHFESDDHYTHVNFASGAHFLLPFGLLRVEEALSGMRCDHGHLVRLGRRYIVNIHYVFHINTIKQQLTLANGQGSSIVLKPSRPVLRELMELMKSLAD